MNTRTQSRAALMLFALIVIGLTIPLYQPTLAALGWLAPQQFTPSKTVNQSVAWPGTPLSYTLSLNNLGGLDLATVEVTDTLPISLTYTANSLSATAGTYGHASSVITWTGSISASEIVTITYGATLSSTLPHGSVVVNTAIITGGGETFTRTATVLVSTNTYLPIIRRDPTPTPTNTPTPTPTPTPVPWVTIISENFEGAFPGPWQLFSNGIFYWGKRDCRPYTGSFSGWGVGGSPLGCFSNYPNDVNSWMVYGPFSLVGATAADLRFKQWVNTELTNDRLSRLASIDDNLYYGFSTSGNTGGWVDRVFDLANVPTLGNLTGRPNVWIALVFRSNGSVNLPEGGYVDEVVLRKCASGCTGITRAAPASPNDRSVEVPSMATRPR